MEHNEIKTVLENTLSLQKIYISGDGSHFQIIAVSEIFTGMNRVKKQQIVYAPLMKYITDNHIHSLSIKTYTPEEWEKKMNIIKCKSKTYNN